MSKAKTLTEEERETSGGTLAIILLCVIIVWATGGWLADLTNKMDRGTFGDMFGAVNSLFSGLAFATLIYTTFLQRWELRETRKELMRTAAAQEASETALRVQAEAAAKSANLAAVNALLTYYRGELERGRKNHSYMGNTSDREEFARVLKCEKELVQILEATYQEITTEGTAKRQTNSGISADLSPQNSPTRRTP